MSNDQLYDDASAFYKESRAKINRIVADKVKSLGITLSDLRNNKDRYSPVNAVDQTPEVITEQYDVMGIHLLTVKWSKGECQVIHPEKDEKDIFL